MTPVTMCPRRKQPAPLGHPQRMHRLAVLVALIALAGTASAQDVASPVTSVAYDLFEPVSVQGLQLEQGGCGAGRFHVGPDSFTFDEGQAEAGQPPPGYTAAGCGEAGLAIKVPFGTDHLHVRFEADRRIDTAPTSPFVSPVNFTQELWLLDGEGKTLYAVPYYHPTDPASPARSIAVPSLFLPVGLEEATLVWRFEDSAFLLAPGAPASNPMSGRAVSATVSGISLEFSGVPAAGATVTLGSERQGTSLLRVATVDVPVPPTAALAGPNGSMDLWVRLDPAYTFRGVAAPDGTLLEATVTRLSEGPQGWDRSRLLVERTDRRLQVTVPGELLEAHGPGTYRLAFDAPGGANARPALIPVAIALLLTPVPFAIVAFRKAGTFAHEAFGHYRKSAQRLRLGVVLVGLYYAAVVASAFVGDRLDAMATIPMRAEAFLLYLQVAIAILAFTTLWLVAREMYLITQPRQEAPPET